MPRATRFPNGLQTGRDPGIGATGNTIGDVVQSQSIDVSAGGLDRTFYYPPNSYPIDMYTLIRAVDASSQGINVQVGTPTDATHYATFLVSAAGNYRITTASGAAWAAGFGTADQNAVAVKVTAAFAMSGFNATVNIIYAIRG